MAVSGIIAEGCVGRLEHELRQLEGRALLIVLDLSGVLVAHVAALNAVGAAGRRAARERRRLWVVPPPPSDSLLAIEDGRLDIAVVSAEGLRCWLTASGLTLVDPEVARVALSLVSLFQSAELAHAGQTRVSALASI